MSIQIEKTELPSKVGKNYIPKRPMQVLNIWLRQEETFMAHWYLYSGIWFTIKLSQGSLSYTSSPVISEAVILWRATRACKLQKQNRQMRIGSLIFMVSSLNVSFRKHSPPLYEYLRPPMGIIHAGNKYQNK